MIIVLNGAERSVRDGLTALQLTEELGLTSQRIAMEVNLEILPRSQYAGYVLQPGDRVEVVHAIGGG